MGNSVIDDRSAAIIEAVSYWLGYQYKIGRNQLIHEASLRYPIADTITSKGTSINRIVLEQLHPIFKSKKIDLVIYNEDVIDPSSEENDEKLNEVFEFKIAKSDTSKFGSIEHQRVFDDVVRLAYYHQWHNKNCYFLMCGKYEEFKAYFIGQRSEISEENGKKIVTPRRSQEDSTKPENREWKPDGIYKDWFGFKIGEVKEINFEVSDSKNEDEFGLQSFKRNYQIRMGIGKSFGDKVNVKTTCLAITSPGIEKTRTHAAGIWKIE